jgi:DNA-binding NarL/FixJ family response regulator
MTIRVLIADDEAIVRDGLRAIVELEEDLEVIAEAADGAEAVELARRLGPDVVLVDIRMPIMDGLEATRRLLGLPQPPRVLVLTTFDRNEYVYEAMKAGASGFLLKDVRRGQLTDAIRKVGQQHRRRGRPFAPAQASPARGRHLCGQRWP